jgi:thioredoxin-like negative regulator of GroEL
MCDHWGILRRRAIPCICALISRLPLAKISSDANSKLLPGILCRQERENEQELAACIQRGNEALARGDKQQAAEFLAQALEMSQRAGNEQISDLLRAMVSRGPDGRAQLKNVDAIARKTLEIKQGTTSRLS